jgi:hypothetical protein
MNLAAWLRGLGLDQYEAAFRGNGVDASVLPDLTADDLKEMGVAAVGHRRKLLAAIAGLRRAAPPLSTVPATAPTPPAEAVPVATPPGDGEARHGGAGDTGAERRQLTVLFCDWSARPRSRPVSTRRTCARSWWPTTGRWPTS